MNSEELEQSLKTEFEMYLKNISAEMKQSFAEFQRKMLEDQEHQRARMDEAFQGFAARFESEHDFDGGFRESVAEHLKLARDEGAKLSATAFAEAEKLQPAAAPTTSFADMRDAIADVSSQDSQSAILKTLVEHASAFAPRGAFFIIKNEHIAGWKVFGGEADGADSTIREIHFPVSNDSILGSAVASKAMTQGSYGANSQDDAFLNPLDFGQPDRMCAIPLVARGRSVAVMYADHGTQGGAVNVEALETLVRVAGLTVEMLAASTGKSDDSTAASSDFESVQETAHSAANSFVETPQVSAFEAPVQEIPPPFETATVETEQFSFTDNQHATDAFGVETPFESPVAENPFERAFEQPAESQPEPAPEFETHGGAMVFDSGGSIEPAAPPAREASPFDRAVEPFEPAGTIGGGMAPVAEPAVQMPAAPVPQARLSDRPVDLPIEVPEEERRLHNDARRFARLLVSEIKLYNEKKVLEGRQAHDLYDRLREAIDRSREMYDKRVQPPVAARFDYFHYELLNSLADGDAARFGQGYPGATV